MDKIRFALWFGLLASVWISYTTWVSENQSAAPEEPAAEPLDELPSPNGGGELPEIPRDDRPAEAASPPAGETEPGRLIFVRTDVLDLVIDLNGGDIVRADLPGYPVDKAKPDQPVRLLDDAPASLWVYETGLRSTSAGGGPEPNHQQPFQAANESYTLADGEDVLELRLEWLEGGALRAEKVYTFRRGRYDIGLELVLVNGTAEGWRGWAYTQMSRVHAPLKRSYLSVDSYSFTGPALYDGNEYEKQDFDDLLDDPVEQTVANGWLASIQHHFLAAAVPPPDEATLYRTRASGNRYSLTAISPNKEVAPGAELRYAVKLFVGPKLQGQLAETGPELERTVDYGVLYFLSRPLFLVLDFVHGWVNNWGLAIVIVTMLIKLVFYKLTATSGRSMAKMRKLAPRMKALQEKHKEDRQALSQAMMELYKQEKVNPAAGCLPLLIQMPFFFAFYWVLVESVEMRQAPFMLWIDDLSVRDPFFILPILMGGAMLFQMRLNPSPPDPVQARVMQIMPIVFTGMFAFFPAGLVLYWLTNTVISIAQQWRINQLVVRES
jgi:YidC/Oxa1 family membrane protein insertase